MFLAFKSNKKKMILEIKNQIVIKIYQFASFLRIFSLCWQLGI
jgi:hypothetical protein